MTEESDMTMEQLAEDWKVLRARAKEKLTSLATSADIATFLRGDLLPFLENHVQQSVEMDGCIEDLMYKQDDALQPETASIFAGVILGGLAMAEKLEALSPKGGDGKLADAQLAKMIDEFRNLCRGAQTTLAEITIPEDPDAVDEDADEDGEDDEDEDEDDDEDDIEGDDQ